MEIYDPELYLTDLDFDNGLDEDEYEVEKILKHRRVIHEGKRILEYYIKWKGFDDNWNTWEPEDGVNNAKALVHEYWSSRSTGRRKRKSVALPLSLPQLEQQSTTTTDTRKRSKLYDEDDEPSEDEGQKRIRKLEKPVKRVTYVSQQPQEKNVSERDVDENYYSDNEEEQEKEKEKNASSIDTSVNRSSSIVSNNEEDTLVDVSAPPSSSEWMDENDEVIVDLDFRSDLSWDWKTNIRGVEAITQEGPVLYGIVRWIDGALAMYPTDLIRRRCCQKLIDFYERKLEFEQQNPA